MYTNNKLAKSIRLALAFGAVSTVAFSANAQEATDTEEEAQPERIEVTGSRIKRADLEGALPVTVIDRTSIELSGEISVADVIRNTTFNTTGSFRPQSGSSAQGVSMVDMRGLGSSRTLVLIDGRRLTMSPSTGSAQDLNSIPMAAVERIEILSDGASAIYGSDAIGGVINVITRKDFTGFEMSLGEARVSVPADGGDRNNGSIVFGSSSDKSSLIGGVSWNKREIVYQRDFPWVEPAASTYGNNFINTGVGYYQAIPGSCGDENFISTTIGVWPDGHPLAGQAIDRCQYNYNATNANEASSSNESLFIKGHHEINDEWSTYMNASIAKTESFGRYAPAPDSNYFYAGLTTPADSYNNPTNPNAWLYDANNPNAIAYDADYVGPNAPVWFFHRFAAMGNRDSTVSNENVDLLLGATGTFDAFEVDFGLRRVRNKSVEIGNGYLAATTAWGNVNDFNPGYCSDGSFDATNCRFGYDLQFPSANPDDVLAAGVVTTSRISSFDIDEVYVLASFDLWDMAGGMAAGSAGIERRVETYIDQYDSQSEAGLVGGSAGNSAGGDRSVNAAYFEVLMPVMDEMEVSVAGRFDDYSDYGSDFSPKVSVRYQPTEELVLRASYGLGFRAPTLDILTMKTAFSAASVTDPVTCQYLNGGTSPSCQVNTYVQANPDLGSESSKQYALGVAYEPTDWASFKLDYFNIQIEDQIRYFGAVTLISREAAGEAVPAGLGVTRNSDGVITRVDAGYGNEGTFETDGIDFNAQFKFDLDSMGYIFANVSASHTFNLSTDSGRSVTEDFGVPAHRVNAQVSYTYGDFDIGYNMNLIGSQYTDTDLVDGVIERTGHVGTWVTHDLQVGYNTTWGGKVVVGAQNLFEKMPQLLAYDGRDYNYNLYNAYGRITYVPYTQSF